MSTFNTEEKEIAKEDVTLNEFKKWSEISLKNCFSLREKSVDVE